MTVLTGLERPFQTEDGQWVVRTVNSLWDVRRKAGQWAVRRVEGALPLTPRSSENWKDAVDVRWYDKSLLFAWTEREATITSAVQETMVLGPAVRS